MTTLRHTLLVSIGLLLFASGANATPNTVRDRIRREASAFDLADVRLLDGPFKKAMLLDSAYLLRLEPDRLLSWFRKEAGLKPKGEVYGGWEARGIAGHSLGHYLTACAMMFASTGDVRFRQRVNYIVTELELCQRANGNGYVAAIPNGKKIFNEVAAGDIRSQGFDLNGGWVPWYTMHKVFAGLLDANQFCGNRKALTVAVKLADWADATLANLTEEQFQRMLACEHGGMNESLAELYARTGNEKYLRLSRRFHHKAVLDPLARREDRLQGRHANTQIPKLIGLARRYELTEDAADRTAAEFFWDRVVHHHSYVTGGNSDGEHFGPPDKLNDRLTQNTTETCNTYNMLKLTRHLFQWRASAEYADYYERALYNHILASQNPDDGMVCYFVPLKAGSRKTYSTPFDSFWCCVGSGIENHAKYGDSIYFHSDDSLWVNLFIPSELTWRAKGLSLRQQTRYPDADTTSLTFKARRPVALALRLRYPAWATRGINVSVNGRPQSVNAKPGSFVEIRRTWKNGDRVQLKIPMSLRLEPLPDNPNRIAVLYGPTVLAGELGAADEAGVANLILVPALITENKPLVEWIKPAAGGPSKFRTAGVGRPRDVTLSPFYRMHHTRYAVYWDRFTPQQWVVREADYKAELERARRLEEITVDFAQPGEMQPERDHNMQGERTDAGEHSSRKWRHARDGGWVSFDLKVLPDQPVSLVCTYWGSETGARTFDVLVGGVKIATQSLQNNKPGEFFEVTYAIPEELTRGKTKITVRFQPQPGNTAGGFYGLRVIHGK
ncbi:MAG: glycoside hydrolase family 127 protein [Pyrinomonadaceae bacterium]|nr:glycoside hydrolase family 127 protein [Pyrinomonadaceae bacterium]